MHVCAHVCVCLCVYACIHVAGRYTLLDEDLAEESLEEEKTAFI